MLVYCTTVWLKNPTDRDLVLSIISKWLSFKARENVTKETLIQDGIIRNRDGSSIQCLKSDSQYPILHAICYSHGDQLVSGRQWTTEIGIKQDLPGSDIECSILLRTSEISARVDAKVQPSRPRVISDIIEQLTPSTRTCGLSVKTVDTESVEAFRYVVTDDERRHPVVLLSPTESGNFLVDAARLSSLLVGLADVVVIRPGSDTFLIARVLGEQNAAWKGAINIIFPEQKTRERKYIPTKRLMPAEIEEIISSGVSPESEIFSMVTHKTNFPNSRRHISPELVRETRLTRELARLREESVKTGENTQYISILEHANEEQLRTNERFKSDAQFWEDEWQKLDEENRQLRYANEGLKSALAKTVEQNQEVSGASLPEAVREAFISLGNVSPTPRESLIIVSALFPERVVVLESAWESAKKSEGFREQKRAFELLWKLATAYWEALVGGRGDAQARVIFGASYSAKESESVESNKRACQLRTFVFRGQNIEMMRHLKIGVKDSIVETLRIHFAWDHGTRKLIIGHCGPHLDHR